MEYAKRKPNRLKQYDYSAPGAYFVTICTKDKEKLLCSIVGGGAHDAPQIILSPEGKIVEKYIVSTNNIDGLSVEKYVIMPNHIHMIIRIEGDGSSRAPTPTNAKIPHAISTLKRFCIREIGSEVFQRSYHDHIIRNMEDYLKIWNYIETNPIKWKEDCFFFE